MRADVSVFKILNIFFFANLLPSKGKGVYFTNAPLKLEIK